MRIAIYGTGGVGGYYGARLAAAGHEVWFIARGAHLAAIRANGLRVESVMGDLHLQPTLATDTPAEIGAVDVVILAVKTWQVTEAATAMRPLIGAETMVLPLQNGVEAAGQVAAIVGDAHVLAGESRVLSMIAAPGVIRQVGGPASITFAERDSQPSERTQRLLETFNTAAIPATITPDIQRALWEKLLLVSSVGGVGAVSRAPIGITRSQPESRAMIEAAMHEVYAVAVARGVAMSEDAIATALASIEQQPEDGTTSMQRDIWANKPSELEAWNGAVSRLGQEAGVPTPTHTFLYHALLPLERRARGILAFA